MPSVMPKHAPAMSEAEFQSMVVELARACGWKTMHVRRSIGKGRKWTTATSVVGWPDLTIYRPGRLIFAELKAESGRLTQEQAVVLGDLHFAGAETYVWKPSDLDEIAQILGRRGRRAIGGEEDR